MLAGLQGNASGRALHGIAYRAADLGKGRRTCDDHLRANLQLAAVAREERKGIAAVRRNVDEPVVENSEVGVPMAADGARLQARRSASGRRSQALECGQSGPRSFVIAIG